MRREGLSASAELLVGAKDKGDCDKFSELL